MSGFQPGDVIVAAGGNSYTLRLTLGALAEMSARLGAAGPLELADKMRGGIADDIAVIVTACLRPVHGHTALSKTQMRRVFTALPPLFEAAFNTEQET